MRINKEGIPSILFVIILTIAASYSVFRLSEGAFYWWIIMGVLVVISIFVITFFRMPVRTPKGDDKIITAPADGKIVIIDKVFENEYLKREMIQISVYMNFFNIHANWYPISGVISFFRYHAGRYLAAWHPKSSEKNERTTIVITNKDGVEVLCRQIAGKYARRVVCYAELDKQVKAGDEIGFIKFGSRADIFVPVGTEVCVNIGDKVKGAESILAKLK